MNKEQVYVNILIEEYMKLTYALCCIHTVCKTLKKENKKKIAIDDILKLTSQVILEGAEDDD